MLLRLRECLGEIIGTFILVFFGCGTVVVSVLFLAHSGLFQISAIWGIAVTLAIYTCRNLSCAHFNPAVSIAMVISKRMPVKKLPFYIVSQFLGAMLAALVLLLLFDSSIAMFEDVHNITRGSSSSVKTAMMFGEFYPNPSAMRIASVTTANAFLAEAIGTFFLVFLIMSLTEGCNVGRPDTALAPVFIGLTVTVIISIIAPLTQAGLNPARDLAPRLVAYFAGWGSAAFPDKNFGFLTVYVLGPIVGGTLASLIFTTVIEPLMTVNKTGQGCCLVDQNKITRKG